MSESFLSKAKKAALLPFALGASLFEAGCSLVSKSGQISDSAVNLVIAAVGLPLVICIYDAIRNSVANARNGWRSAEAAPKDAKNAPEKAGEPSSPAKAEAQSSPKINWKSINPLPNEEFLVVAENGKLAYSPAMKKPETQHMENKPVDLEKEVGRSSAPANPDIPQHDKTSEATRGKYSVSTAMPLKTENGDSNPDRFNNISFNGSYLTIRPPGGRRVGRDEPTREEPQKFKTWDEAMNGRKFTNSFGKDSPRSHYTTIDGVPIERNGSKPRALFR